MPNSRPLSPSEVLYQSHLDRSKPRICSYCREMFKPRKAGQLYCSSAHRVAAWRIIQETKKKGPLAEPPLVTAAMIDAGILELAHYEHDTAGEIVRRIYEAMVGAQVR